MCDDVFNEDDERILPEENEWNKIQKNRVVDGFRDGLAKGEEEQLQRGFNLGYKSAVEIAFNIAKLRGTISAIIGRNITSDGVVSRECSAELEDLLEKVIKLEADFVHKKEPSKELQLQEVKATGTHSNSNSCDETSCKGGKCKLQESAESKSSTPEHAQNFEIFIEKTRTLQKNLQELMQGNGIENLML